MRLASKGYEKQKRLPDFREFKCFSLQLFGWWCYERKNCPKKKVPSYFQKMIGHFPQHSSKKNVIWQLQHLMLLLFQGKYPNFLREDSSKRSMYKKVNLNILLSSSNLDMKIDPSLFILLHTQNTLSDHCAPHHQHYKQQ